MSDHGKCNGWHSARWSDDQCRVCWNSRDKERHKHVGAEVVTQPTMKNDTRIHLAVIADCSHKGALVARPASCSKTWKYACDVHGTCRLSDCERCSDYRTDAGDELRHLAYYVYPVARNGTWQRNVEQLLERIDLFNGRRVISIATKSDRHDLDRPDLVRDMFRDHPVDIMLVPHGVRKLGEVTAFVPMLNRIKHLPGYTFYAHTKGVTKRADDPAIHRWTTLMYRANLDHWDVVRADLEKYPITGALRKVGMAFGGRVNHHYTGTYFWFRNRDVFARDWKNVPERYGGTEMWPGKLFNADECGCHFFDATGKIMYTPANVTEAEQEYAKRYRPTAT